MRGLPDYHLHTTRCNHATGTMDQYVEAAIAAGLAEIGFSEHLPFMPEPHLAMTFDQVPGYVDEVHRLQDRYSGRIAIRLGGEVDMVMDRLEEIADFAAKWPFDYLIGSVHYLDDWPFDQEPYKDRFDSHDLGDLWDRFFSRLVLAAGTGLFDIAGHIDNLKRMGHHPPDKAKIPDRARDLARVLAARNIAVELNTSGFDHVAGEPYPSPGLLALLREEGVAVTLGSDSHEPRHVARHFGDAVAILEGAGFRELAFFAGRRRTMHPLPSAGGKGESA